MALDYSVFLSKLGKRRHANGWVATGMFWWICLLKKKVPAIWHCPYGFTRKIETSTCSMCNQCMYPDPSDERYTCAVIVSVASVAVMIGIAYY